jgi:hypothetical protein
MMLQEEIVFKEYFRCYCIDVRDVRIMQYNPKAPFHERYVRNGPPVAAELLDSVREGVLRLNRALGYDFNTVEFAVRDGIPYAIDFCNPAPDADVHSIGEDNFEWVVESAANMAVRKALEHRPGVSGLTWGEYVTAAAAASAAAAAAPAAAPPPAMASPDAVRGKAEPGPTPAGHLVGDPVGSTWHQGSAPHPAAAAASGGSAGGSGQAAAGSAEPSAVAATGGAAPPAAAATAAAPPSPPAEQTTPPGERWVDDERLTP